MRKQPFAWLLILIGALLIINPITETYAKTVDELKKQQEDVKATMENTKKEMKTIKIESNVIEGEVKDLDAKVENAKSDLEGVERELAQIETNIIESQKALEEAEKNLEDKTEIFEKRLRVIYMNGNVRYLELLLSSGSIKDFLSRQDMVQTIAEQDKDLIRFMKEQREEIEIRKEELESQELEVKNTKTKIEIKRRELEGAIAQKKEKIEKLADNLDFLEDELGELEKLEKDIEKDIVKLQSINTKYSGGRMEWPVPGKTRVSSPFGYRIHPIFKVKKMHTGIDIPAPTGTNIVAAAPGKVIYSGVRGGYGKVVMIDHGGKIVTLYAHNSSLLVDVGQQVKRGEVVAKAGSTGYSTGPHLHFEVRKDGQYQDPISWVSK